MKTRRVALLCVCFAVLAQLSSGCYYYRPFLCRPLFHGGCWPYCYQPAGAASMPISAGEPGCSSCFSAPAGVPVVQGSVFQGSPQAYPGPTLQQVPQGNPMPMTGQQK